MPQDEQGGQGKTLAGKNRVKFNDFGDGWHGDWRGTFLGTIT